MLSFEKVGMSFVENIRNMSESPSKVKDTTYRSIIRHELGHVVSNMYKLNPMEIAQLVLPGLSNTDIIKYVKENLSLYATDYSDGREFISECFSAYYSGVDNDFAKKTWLSSHRQACGFFATNL